FEEASIIPVPGQASQATVSADLRTLAVVFQDTNVQHILVWDLAANARRWVFGPYSAKVTRLAFSPDGNVLMAACADGEIGLWSVTDGKPLRAPARDPSRTEEDWEQPPFL